MFEYITLKGKRLHRDPTTGKKLLDDNPQYKIGKWNTARVLTLADLPQTPLLLHTGKSTQPSQLTSLYIKMSNVNI